MSSSQFTLSALFVAGYAIFFIAAFYGVAPEARQPALTMGFIFYAAWLVTCHIDKRLGK